MLASRWKLKRQSRAKSMVEYVLIVFVIITCACAMYFSMLLTGADDLGAAVCGECPKSGVKKRRDSDTWDERIYDDAGDRDRDSDPDKDPERDDQPDNVTNDDNTNNDNNDYGDLDGEFWTWIWSNWFTDFWL